MDEPSDADINRVKAEFPNREVEKCSLTDRSGEYWFLLTSPNAAEWDKFQTELSTCKENDITAKNKAVYKLALAQIRQPDRKTVIELFDKKPGFPLNLIVPLREMAGADAEAHLKK